MRRPWLVVGLLLVLCACGAANAAAPRSGLAGRTLAAPTCPVEPAPSDSTCAPRPVSVAIRIIPVGRMSSAMTVHSGADGRFRVRLRAGIYLVRPLARDGSPFPRPPGSFRVRVYRGRFTYRAIYYDTGIR